MRGINVGRWFAGGIVAGIVVWIIEGLASMIYMDETVAALDAVGLSMPAMGVGMFVLTILISFLIGLVLVFFYAAARPRFGPGPRTATLVAFIFWMGSYLVSLVGYAMIGLYPPRLLFLWGAISIVEVVAATVVGAWIYREAQPEAAPVGDVGAPA